MAGGRSHGPQRRPLAERDAGPRRACPRPPGDPSGKTAGRRFRSGGRDRLPTQSGTSWSPVQDGPVDGICSYRLRPERHVEGAPPGHDEPVLGRALRNGRSPFGTLTSPPRTDGHQAAGLRSYGATTGAPSLRGRSVSVRRHPCRAPPATSPRTPHKPRDASSESKIRMTAAQRLCNVPWDGAETASILGGSSETHEAHLLRWCRSRPRRQPAIGGLSLRLRRRHCGARCGGPTGR